MTFTPIDDADLVWMRADYTAALVDTCDLYDDSATRVAVQTGVPCFVAPISALLDPALAPAGDRDEGMGKWHITLPYGTTIHPGWQVRPQDTTKSASLVGRVFTVVGLVSASRDVNTKVRAEEGQ